MFLFLSNLVFFFAVLLNAQNVDPSFVAAWHLPNAVANRFLRTVNNGRSLALAPAIVEINEMRLVVLLSSPPRFLLHHARAETCSHAEE